jgi:HSP90 family molecular chaperone
MTVDLNVLDHLGINLYSNIAAVLTEAVANAWDADAGTVDIEIDPDSNWIEISDNGVGMSVKDMNEKYLRVGYRRREEDAEYGKYTAKGRLVMGRKGLGKLSLFSIAKVIEVQSAKDGESHGLRMSVDGIHESVKNKEPF